MVSVLDPHTFYVDPNPVFFFKSYPDPGKNVTFLSRNLKKFFNIFEMSSFWLAIKLSQVNSVGISQQIKEEL